MKYKFDDIAINCTAKKKPTEEDKDYYLGLEHLDSGTFYVSRWGAEFVPIGDKLIMRKGDLLFGKRRAYQKKVAIAPFDGIFSAHGMVLRPKESVIDPRFFPHFIASDYFLKEAIRISVGGLSPTINWKDLKALEFNLPTLPEQRRLATLLWTANDLKEAYKRAIAASDEMLKAKFREMFIAGSPYPREPLKNFIAQIRGVSYKPEDLHTGLDDDSILLLRANNICDRLINHDDVQYVAKEKVTQNQLIKEGDILVCASSGSLEHVGKAALCPQSLAGETFGAFCKLIRPQGNLLPEYIASYLCTDEYRKTIMQLACGSNINNLKTEHIDELQIPVPNNDEQTRFITCVHSLDKSKHALNKALADLNTTIKGILNQALED